MLLRLRTVLLPALGVLGVLCLTDDPTAAAAQNPSSDTGREDAARRRRMVEQQIAARGVHDPRVLAAMQRVPRHEFVPLALRSFAYSDRPLPIGLQQTISQPYIVALMSEALQLEGDETILEVGTGSGYQAAVLGELAERVYSIEIIDALAQRATTTLERLGYENVHVSSGDGYKGWPEFAPFDAIMVTAAPDHIPQPLLQQLKPGGRLVLPLGDEQQHLVRVLRTSTGFESDTLAAVRFVPMTGEARKGDGGREN